MNTLGDSLLGTTVLAEAGVVGTHETDGRVVGDLSTGDTGALTIGLEDLVVLVGQLYQARRRPCVSGHQQGLKNTKTYRCQKS